MNKRQLDPKHMPQRRSRLPKMALAAIAAATLAVIYVKSHPLVFNESLWEHAHCMPQAGGALWNYALDHDGHFPYHPNGYGDALLLLTNEMGSYWGPLTGPAYDSRVFAAAVLAGRHLPEQACGRVYVQGLSTNNDPQIVILFDKVAAPPDHCHFPERLWRGFVREVCFVDGTWRTVSVARWPDFARQQIDLLVTDGFSRHQAEQLYGQAK
jgi:hypothetical protein